MLPKTRFDPDLEEQERRCSMDGEYWPDTSEFFYKYHQGPRAGKTMSMCKACYDERRNARRALARQQQELVAECCLKATGQLCGDMEIDDHESLLTY